MKPFAIILFLLSCTLISYAQPGKRKMVSMNRVDSLRVVDKKTVKLQTQTAGANNRTAPQRVSNTKLDDLKNPFDTLRSAQPRTVATPRKTATMKTRKMPKQQILGDSLNIKRPPAVIQKQN